MQNLRAALLLLPLGLLPAPFLLAAPDTPARVEVSLTQTAVANPPIGANEFGDPGGTQFSAGNLAAATADPDADGRSNLVEYAFGSHPLAADSPPWSIGLSGTPARLAATLPLWAGNDDITITVTVEASGDLTSWTSLARSTAGTTMTALANSITINTTGSAPATITVLDDSANTSATRRFFRVSVSAQ